MISSQKTTCDKATETRGHIYTTQPQIRITNAEFSDNESNISEDDCKSLNASQTNIRKSVCTNEPFFVIIVRPCLQNIYFSISADWSVTKTFTKLAITKNKNGLEDSKLYYYNYVVFKLCRLFSLLTWSHHYLGSVGPPVPPRPPKTFARARDVVQKEIFSGPKIEVPNETVQESIAVSTI